MAEADVVAVRHAYEALGAGDPGPVVALLHPDIEWIEPDGAPGVGAMTPGSGVYRGRDDVLTRMLGRLPEIWDGFRWSRRPISTQATTSSRWGRCAPRIPRAARRRRRPSPTWRVRGGQAVWWRCDEDTALLHRARGAL